MCFSIFLRQAMIGGLIISSPAWAQMESNEDKTDPLSTTSSIDLPPQRILGTGFAALTDRSKVTFDVTYYGRARNGKSSDAHTEHYGDINTNVLGLGIGITSGYAWDTIGFDLSGYSNIGSERGQSELLDNRDYTRTTINGLQRGQSYAAINQAALKLKLGESDLGMEARGGYTPIKIGTLGTSGGLHTHSYRGVELKGFLRNVEIGYGWADQFHNEWGTSFRDITTRWDQNRSIGSKANTISYIHSIGGRYAFGPNKAAFVDIGIGEGKDFRKNAQMAVSYPFTLERLGSLTTTGYGYWGRYNDKLGAAFINGANASNEYHVSLSAQLDTADWMTMIGYGYTHAPDSWEQQFRMTPWGNSDNRNFIQTWGQIDDFVWDGQSVLKISASYQIGTLIEIPGLAIGGSALYGWGMKNRNGPNAEKKGTSFEVDYKLTYSVQKGFL